MENHLTHVNCRENSKKKFSLSNLFFRLVQVVADKEEDSLDLTEYRIEENSEDNTSYVMNKIEDGSGITTLFDIGEELDDGDNNNINMSDDESHGMTYTIEELDDGEHNMDDEDHYITVTNKNEPVSTRHFFCLNFVFISSQLDGEEVYHQLIRNQKGREKLYADGYGFHRNGKRAGTIRWICEFYTTNSAQLLQQQLRRVFQCSVFEKVCKDYRGMRIHQSHAHKVKKQKSANN